MDSSSVANDTMQTLQNFHNIETIADQNNNIVIANLENCSVEQNSSIVQEGNNFVFGANNNGSNAIQSNSSNPPPPSFSFPQPPLPPLPTNNDAENLLPQLPPPQPVNIAKRQRSRGCFSSTLASEPKDQKRARKKDIRDKFMIVPDEVLQKILLLTPQRDRMYNLPKVCKRWNNMVKQSAWGNFRFPMAYLGSLCQKDDDTTLVRIQTWISDRAPTMRNVTIMDIGWGDVTVEQRALCASLVTHAQNVESMQIEVTEGSRLLSWLEMMAESGLNLKSLKVRCMDQSTTHDKNFSQALMNIDKFGRNLEDLSIIYSGVLSNNFMYNLLPTLTSLTSLRFKGLRDLKLGDGMVNLQNLEILNVNSCEISVMRESVSKLPALHSASFEHSNFLQITDVYNIFQNKNLKSLSLAFCNLVKFPERLIEAPIEHLNLASCGLSKLPPSFLSLQNLKTLDLSNNFFDIFPRILIKLPDLTSVNMSWQYQMGISCKEAMTWGVKIPEKLQLKIDLFENVQPDYMIIETPPPPPAEPPQEEQEGEEGDVQPDEGDVEGDGWEGDDEMMEGDEIQEEGEEEEEEGGQEQEEEEEVEQEYLQL